jgi:hypothetical protein
MPRRERCRKEMPAEFNTETQELTRYFRSDVATSNRIDTRFPAHLAPHLRGLDSG